MDIALGNSFKFSVPETAVNFQNVWNNIRNYYTIIINCKLLLLNCKLFDHEGML